MATCTTSVSSTRLKLFALLQNAASVSGLLITTEAAIAEAPKKEGDAPAMPDMGGMEWVAWASKLTPCPKRQKQKRRSSTAVFLSFISSTLPIADGGE